MSLVDSTFTEACAFCFALTPTPAILIFSERDWARAQDAMGWVPPRQSEAIREWPTQARMD